MECEPKATPQARRRARTEARLRAALDRLQRDESGCLNVAALAREAGVGRNAIYSNHNAILADLRQAAAQREVSQAPNDADRASDKQRLIAELRKQVQRLATENVALLKRTLDAEAKSARLERRAAQLIRDLDEVRRPVPLRLREEA
jgi:hypothetical protein